MSKVEVNTVEPQCGTTLTLGGSGDTVALGSGASQTGFGRTGTVDWQTADIKTAAFIPAVGKGYFVNTTGGAVTVNLPAGSAGDIVGLKDYAGTWQTNAVTLNPNGVQLIGGGNDQDPTLTSAGGAVLLVYVDGTQGWLTTQESVTASPSGIETFIVATGGTPCSGAIVCTNYKVHTFTGPGTFCVSQVATCATNNLVSYGVVAGGGAGNGNCNANSGGAGGAGGFREVVSPSAPYTGSPLDGYATPANLVTVTATGYPIDIGAGGTGATNTRGSNGANSIFSTITSTGGGAGGGPIPASAPAAVGSTGGSGGGAGGGSSAGSAGAAGNTPPTTPPQGQPGGLVYPGNSPDHQSAGGGGAGALGGNGTSISGGTGGTGVTTSISGSPTAYAGGGGGTGYFGAPGVSPGYQGNGSSCGTGGQGIAAASPYVAESGTINRGGGGGAAEGYTPPGSANPSTGGGGGSGIVIIRYKFQ